MNETGADSNTNESNTNESNTNDKIKELSSVEIRSSRARIYCLTVVGEIEGHIISPPTVKVTKYEHIIPELVRVEEDSEVDALMILLNTVGGDVEAGLAIAELISSMKKPTVSLVLGGGHSIGVPLAVSTDFSLIVPSATMTVHPIRTTGTTITAPQTFEQMYKLQDRLISFVTKHSGIKEKKLREMMLDPGNISNDMGTVLFGEEAVECGLINKTGGLSDAISHINSLVESGK
ncbi:MAG: translocation-enhancing protein TepA [Clostridiales bacterium]|nr:translocation-enhancing protein TepA [Clostridiales bacterium]